MGKTDLCPTLMPAAHPWRGCVGKRCIVRGVKVMEPDPLEVRVVEVAPSGRFVKFWWNEESAVWYPVDAYELVEELPPTDLPPRPAAGQIARTAWWLDAQGNPKHKVGWDHRTREGALNLVMELWSIDPFGVLVGFDGDLKLIAEGVNGTGNHHRADFERQVAAWLEIHWPRD